MPDANTPTHSPRARKQHLLIWIGVVLLVIAVGIAAWRIIDSTTSRREDIAEVITHSTDTPNETKPTSDFAWKGGSTDPKKIAIESIGVDAYLQNVGVDQDSLIAVPNNIHIGGWFVNSVKPGDKGLSIIDGHVDGVTSNTAIFSQLGNVKAGDAVSVTTGNDDVRRFEVVKTIKTTTEEAPAVLYSQDPSIESQLTLITCTGTYGSDRATYDKRLIVITKRIS